MGSPILVIHEQAELRGVVRRALEQAGHSVLAAEDIGGAVRLRDRLGPELILIPWTTLSAVRELLSRLKDHAQTRQSHVIVLAPAVVMAEAIVALEFGADDCVSTAICWNVTPTMKALSPPASNPMRSCTRLTPLWRTF